MAIELGLIADLKNWKNGMAKASVYVKHAFAGALKPFDREVAASASNLKSAFGGVKGLLVGVAAAAATQQVVGFLKDSFAAADEFGDSLVKIDAALRTLPDAMKAGFDAKRFAGFREDLRAALGINESEANGIFADFLTKGFSTKEAEQLVALAANVALKTGQPLAEVASSIAKAANGGVKALDGLGIKIAATGDLVKDGEAAVLALKAAYGDIGADLVDPTDQLAANWHALKVTLGEELLPIFEPLIQGASDFMGWLLKSDEGRAALERVVDAIKLGVEWGKQAFVTGEAVFDMLRSGASVALNVARAMFMKLEELILDFLRASPLVALTDKMGLTDSARAKSAFGESRKHYEEEAAAAMKEFGAARDRWRNGEGGTATNFIRNAVSEGEKIREEATARVAAEFEATRGVGFAGAPARDAEEQKRREAQEKERERAQKEQERIRKEEERAYEKSKDEARKQAEKFGVGLALDNTREVRLQIADRGGNKTGKMQTRPGRRA